MIFSRGASCVKRESKEELESRSKVNDSDAKARLRSIVGSNRR